MNIAELNKAAVLAALYNYAQPQGMGFMQYNPEPMTVEQAEELIKKQTYFNYLHGRVMKINLSKDEVDTSGYNCDNGYESAEDVIEDLRKNGDVNSPNIQASHQIKTMLQIYKLG